MPYKNLEDYHRQQEKYNQSTEGKKIRQEYQQSEKGKRVHKKYWESEKGKELNAKNKAKRKRNLGWILMFPNPFDVSILVDYHHVTDVYVVAVPRDLHILYMGKYHREKVMSIVKQIYLQRD